MGKSRRLRTRSWRRWSAVLAMVLGSAVAQTAAALVVNHDFELGPTLPSRGWTITSHNTVPGWTSTTGEIEIWRTNGIASDRVPSYSGGRHVELNANRPSTLFQDLSGILAGQAISWQFAHRGRRGPDTLEMSMTDVGADGIYGTADDRVLASEVVTTGRSDWEVYASSSSVLALGNDIRFSFRSLAYTGPGPSYGNLLDAAQLNIGSFDESAVVPLPQTGLLIGGAVAGLMAVRRRRQPSV